MVQIQFTYAEHGLAHLVNLFDSAFLRQHTKEASVCVHTLLWEIGLPFRHIVEMFWAPMHGAQVPKVLSLQNR
jgi:hypothetical protein